MKIEPLRNYVLVRYLPDTNGSKLHIVRPEQAVRKALVLAVGPECREVKVEFPVLVNSAAATVLGEQVLVPESAILGVL